MLARASACAIVLMVGLPAEARLTPVLRGEVPRLVKKKAALWVTRPVKAYPTSGGERRRLLPGDRLRASALHTQGSRVIPNRMRVSFEGTEFRVKLEFLSRTRPDYTYRGKGSFKTFHESMLRDLLRLMNLYVKIARKHKYRIPITDKDTKKTSDDYQRARAILAHVSWVRNQMFKIAYSGRSERSVLKKEADWILPRGEAFIRGFAGKSAPEKKERLKKIYKLMNRLGTVRSAVARINRLDGEIAGLDMNKKYKDLAPAHRARLLSEDLAKLHTEQAKWRTRLDTGIVVVRSEMLILGIKVR